MPTVRVPLVGSFNTRSIDGSMTLSLSEDQRFLNCTFNLVQNTITGKSTIYVEKRPGWSADSVVSSGIASTGLIRPQAFNAALSAFGETSSNIYVGTVNVGVITGRALHFTETLISASSYVLMRASDGSGWYYPDGAKDVLTYTGRISTSSFIVTTISSTQGIYSGQLVTGTGIGVGARVTSVNFAASTIGLNVTSGTASTSTISITKEPIATILDTNFVSTGTHISAFAAMDGYHFYATEDGYVNNSDLNTVTVYGTASRLAVQQSPDPEVGVAVQKNTVVVFGQGSNEKMQNANLSGSGSPLLPVKTAIEHVGALDQRSITTIEDDIYFVSTPYEGDLGVYRMRNLQTQKVSTPNIDRIIGTAAASGAIYANSFKLGGYSYASFTLSLASDGPLSNLLLESGDALLLEDGTHLLLEDTPAQTASFLRTLVYNATIGIWSEWDSDEATFIDSVGSGTNNQLIATSRFKTDGKTYKIDPVSAGAVYQDDGAAVSTQIRTSRLDHATGKRKYDDVITLICDKHSAGTATLEASNDDYQTWETLGTFDLTVMRPQITRCGAYDGGRAYRLTHSYNGPFRAEALEITFRAGLS